MTARLHPTPRRDRQTARTREDARRRARAVFTGDEWRADGPDGRSLGLFQTRADAEEAISETRGDGP